MLVQLLMDARDAAQSEARGFVGVARFVSNDIVWCGNYPVGAQAIKLFSLHMGQPGAHFCMSQG